MRVWQLMAAMGEIAVYRRGPESLPDSSFLLGLLLVVDLILGLGDLALYGSLNAVGLMLLATHTVLLFAFVFALLMFFKLERRFRQTMSALLGVDVVVYFVFFPVALVGLALNLDLESQQFFSFRLVLYIWWFVVAAMVLARSLSQSLILGFMFAILYFLTSLSITEQFAAID